MGRIKKNLKIDVVTLFPSMLERPLAESLLGRAQKAGLINIKVHQLRKWAGDFRHGKVDDRPYGGGAGMVLQSEPLYRAIKALGGAKKGPHRPWVIYLSPQGKILSQKKAGELSNRKHLILVCGHYESIDERVFRWVDEEISIGDYVLTGGEFPALVLLDAVSRLVPGVVGDPESLVNESFHNGLLDYPHYTRPRVWQGKKVPAVLLSGNHRRIERWRKTQAKKQTRKKRADLLRS